MAASPPRGVTLRTAAPDKQPVLDRLLQTYLAELSPFSGDQPDAGGRYAYDYFPLYWREDGRYPLLIEQDGRLAGFVLVRRLAPEEGGGHSIAEFYVRDEFRGAGVGRAAAVATFDRWPGRWHVGQMDGHAAAQQFWRRVIGDYTQGRYDVTRDDHTGGPAQIFHTPLPDAG